MSVFCRPRNQSHGAADVRQRQRLSPVVVRTLCLVSQAVGHLLPDLITGYLAGHANPPEVLRDVWWALRANDC
jgi:hypothetical protein